MSKSLTDTWLVIKIGRREYAINSCFVKAVTELKHEGFIAESSGTFTRGIYKIFNADIPVIDGYKITREEAQNDSKLNFSKTMTDVKLTYMAWLDCVEWDIMYNSPDDSNDASSREKIHYIETWMHNAKMYNDAYMDKLCSRIKENMLINMSRAKRLVEDRKSGSLGIYESNSELAEIRSHANRYIFDSIDNLIECYTSKMSELCVVVSASGKNFGICIDAVELVTDTNNKATSNQRTVLSAGTIEIRDKVYNVIDLTKLGKTLQS